MSDTRLHVNDILKKTNYEWILHKSICVHPFCSHDDQHQQQQRSVTSTDHDINETIQKRDDHQRRTSSDRQQQQHPREHASSSSRNSKERSYSQSTHFGFFLFLFSSTLLTSRIEQIRIKSKGKFSTHDLSF